MDKVAQGTMTVLQYFVLARLISQAFARARTDWRSRQSGSPPPLDEDGLRWAVAPSELLWESWDSQAGHCRCQMVVELCALTGRVAVAVEVPKNVFVASELPR